jgi:hypothetical protein
VTEREKRERKKTVHMSKAYHEQFRDKNQNGFDPNSKTKSNGKLPPLRPTAVKRSPRSDTYAVPNKQNEPKANPVQNGTQRFPLRNRPIKKASPPPPPEKKRTEPIRRNGVNQSSPKYLTSPADSQELGRKTLRFPNKQQNISHRHSSSPTYYETSAPIPRDAPDRPRRMRVANQDYVIQRRRAPPEPVYDDYHAVSNY